MYKLLAIEELLFYTTSMNTIPYETKQQSVAINADLSFTIKSLLDQQQFYDPQNQAKRLGICSAAWPIFGMLWPSSIQLALKLLKYPINEDHQILEIGCGLGIASLTAQSLGYNITASDRHPLAGKFLAKNAHLNDLPNIRFKHAQWGDVPIPSITDTNAPLLTGNYQHIIASDVLYEPNAAIEVAAFIHEFADEKCTVWIIDPSRGYHNHFTRAMTEYGFSLEEHIRLTEPVNNEPYKGRLLVYTR